jgi:hypothetical protein
MGVCFDCELCKGTYFLNCLELFEMENGSWELGKEKGKRKKEKV